jgi:hypothetical protein
LEPEGGKACVRGQIGAFDDGLSAGMVYDAMDFKVHRRAVCAHRAGPTLLRKTPRQRKGALRSLSAIYQAGVLNTPANDAGLIAQTLQSRGLRRRGRSRPRSGLATSRFSGLSREGPKFGAEHCGICLFERLWAAARRRELLRLSVVRVFGIGRGLK